MGSCHQALGRGPRGERRALLAEQKRAVGGGCYGHRPAASPGNPYPPRLTTWTCQRLSHWPNPSRSQWPRPRKPSNPRGSTSWDPQKAEQLNQYGAPLIRAPTPKFARGTTHLPDAWPSTANHRLAAGQEAGRGLANPKQSTREQPSSPGGSAGAWCGSPKGCRCGGSLSLHKD